MKQNLDNPVLAFKTKTRNLRLRLLRQRGAVSSQLSEIIQACKGFKCAKAYWTDKSALQHPPGVQGLAPALHGVLDGQVNAATPAWRTAPSQIKDLSTNKHIIDMDELGMI